jgi:transcriptional regulator with XRE-family HTH domain
LNNKQNSTDTNIGDVMYIEMKIKEVREQEGISLRELERRTGIERHYLSDLEKMPADEILLAEAIIIAKKMGKRSRRFVRS